MTGRTPALGPGREFDAIRAFLAEAGPLPAAVRVGPGDDAAVLEGGWVLSTDLSMEGVHFRRSWLTDREIGYRAAAAALSDLAAMGARAVGLLVSVAAPSSGVDGAALQAGVREAAEAVGAAVLGGDLSRSPGPLVVDVTVVGRAERPALRSGARPGDELWVTGALGGAAAAVRMREAGREPPAALVRAFARPPLRLGLAEALTAGGSVGALLDLSDGVAGDAGHMAAASEVRLVLDPSALPVPAEVLEVFGAETARELALHGGEDYELLLAAPAGALDAGALEARFGVPLTRVGRVEEGAGVWLQEGDAPAEALARGGWDHLEDGG